MAYTFPLSLENFASKLRLQGMKLRLLAMQDVSTTSGGGLYTAELAPAQWFGEGQIGVLTAQQAAELQAMFEVLDGSMNSFYIDHPLYRYPFSDYWGEVLNSHPTTIKLGSVASNNKEISIVDAPAGFQFPAGTFFHFDYGSNPVHRAFHRIVNTVTANGSGSASNVEVRPHIRPGFSVGTVLEFKRPALEAKIIPASYSEGGAESVIVMGMGFQFQQVI